MKLLARALVIVLLSGLGVSPAAADTYIKANFSGGIFGGGANVKAPFSGNGFTQGQTFTGSFVFDNALVPAGGSGFVNVFQQSFPDIANIPAADAFTFNFGPYTLAASDNIDALLPLGIQYNNGHFNGFVFISDFLFQGNYYQLNLSGGSLSVNALDGVPNPYDQHGYPTGSSLINGYINIGDVSLTSLTPYTPITPPPPPVVPEPASWLMMLAGFALTGARMRSRRRILRAA